LENTQLLIQYSFKLPSILNNCFLIDAMFKRFEDLELLDSKQGMLLWSHVKYTMEEQSHWKKVPIAAQKLCTDVLDKLANYKVNFFQHYQKYVEDERQKLINLHGYNCQLFSILSEFVNWYYKKEDTRRVKNLLSVARGIGVKGTQLILTQLQVEMQKYQQMDTFEVFYLFNMVKLYMSLNNLHPKLKSSFERLKAKAPACLRLLLWPEEEENQLRLVNKFFDAPICIQQEKIVCSSSSLNQELFFSAAVNPYTALTTFSFKSGTTYCKLNADALEDYTTLIGTQWKLKAQDETHVEIFTDHGECQQ
jgi:hypothetical protein